MADNEFQTNPMNADSNYESSECPEEEMSEDEAFSDSPARNLLQLAAALQMPVNDMRYALQGLGLDLSVDRQLLKLAEHLGSACYVYHGHKLHLCDQPTQRRTDHPLSIVAYLLGPSVPLCQCCRLCGRGR